MPILSFYVVISLAVFQHLTKPDKGSVVVILNKSDYIKKMGSILEDKTKFLNMGGVYLHDNTAKNEQKLQKHLLDLANQISWLVMFMIGFDPQAHNDRECMACPKHIKKISHLDLFYR